ncbi:hypothetical protein GGI12_004689 [Dipsacomyces acuminosporus]|nr:hypothetical protein GGI12_004689 [Dipsacomyces acuminosporus]
MDNNAKLDVDTLRLIFKCLYNTLAHRYCDKEIVNVPSALDSFGFGSSSWLKLVNLSIVKIARHSPVPASNLTSSEIEAKASELTEYFACQLPNIHQLTCKLQSDAVGPVFTHRLVDAFVKQLSVLNTGRTPITFSQHFVAENITHLHLTMSSHVTKNLPQIRALPLQYLVLFDVPPHFTWRAFYGSSPGAVRFTNLRELYLYFSSEQASEASLDSLADELNGVVAVDKDESYRQLCFPKLETLTLGCSPYKDAGFYRLFASSPLKNLLVGGSYDSMKNMDMRLLSTLSYLEICIFHASQNENGDFSCQSDFTLNDYQRISFYVKDLFECYSRVETALISIVHHPLPLAIPDTVGWLNLRRLILSVAIYFSSIVKIATLCPALNMVVMWQTMVNDMEDIDGALQQLLSHDSTQNRSTNTRLEHLCLHRLGNDEPTTCLKMLLYLGLAIQSLRKIAFPDHAFADMDAVIAEHSGTFPRLGDIKERFASSSDYYTVECSLFTHYFTLNL